MPEKRLFTVDDVFAFKIAAELSVGPGARVAYTVREADMEESAYRTHVWLTAPDQEPVQLTRGEKGCSGPQWSPDGKYLAFTSTRPDGKAPADNGARPQLWLLPAAGGEAFCATKAQFGVRSFRWSSDGKSVLFIAEEPETEGEKARKAREKKIKADGAVTFGDRRRRQIWQVEAKAGAEAKVVYDGDKGVREIAPSPDGRFVAFSTNYSGLPEDGNKTDLWVAELATGQATRLTQGTGGLYGFAWSLDSSRLAFMAPHDPRYTYSRVDLFTIPAAGGEPANLFEKTPATFQGDASEVVWETADTLLLTAAEGCCSYIYRVNVSTGAMTRLTPEAELASGMAVSGDRRHVAYIRETTATVTEVMLLDLTTGEPARALTDLNPWLGTDVQLAEQRVISWQSTEGFTIEGVLTLPPDHVEGQRHPLAVHIHGGPHARTVNRLQQGHSFQVLAARGYAVFSPNFRGSSSYGHAFAVANRRDIGGGDWRDIMTGVDYVIALSVADGDRMGIFGGSYGGYMTNWAIGQTNRFKAAVSMFGMFSLLTSWSLSEIPGWERGYLGAHYWEDPEIYTQCAPSTYLKNINTPVLILHGDVDTNTHPANSLEMWQALRFMGKTVEHVHYPREGHGFVEPNHKKDEYRRVQAWFGKYLKGETGVADGAGTAAKGHTLSVAAVEQAEGYSGRKPKGRFAEVAVRVNPAGTCKLDLSEVRLVKETEERTWEVGVAGVVAGLVLVPASGALEMSAPAAITLAFDVPAKAPAGHWRLVTAQFPDLKLTVK